VASASFVNSAAAGSGLGLVGAYYSNQLGTFVPPPTLVRTDAVVNFNWTGAAPDPSIGSTNFSVSWTGCVQPQYTETYTFYTLSDAGARLWINGQLLINDWSNQPPTQGAPPSPCWRSRFTTSRWITITRTRATRWRNCPGAARPRPLPSFPNPSFIPSPTRRRWW
jgi:hypothetical protein